MAATDAPRLIFSMRFPRYLTLDTAPYQSQPGLVPLAYDPALHALVAYEGVPDSNGGNGASSGGAVAWADVTGKPDATTTQKGITIYAGDGQETAGRGVLATDARLKNARAPTAHAGSHATGGGDELTPAQIGLGNVENTRDADKPISAATAQAFNDFAAQLADKADDGEVVHKTGAESVAGIKTFSSAVIVPPPSSSNHAINRGFLETYVAQQMANRAGEPAAGVQNLSELAGVAASARSDKQTRLVEDEGASYYYDAQSSAAAQSNRVIVPTDGIGRWFKGTADTQDHNNLLGVQGGTATERYHMTAAEKGRIPSPDVTAALTGTSTPNAGNKFVTANSLADEAASRIGADIQLQSNIDGKAARLLGGLNAAEQGAARANIGANRYDFGLFASGKPAAGAVIFRHSALTAFGFAANMSGSRATLGFATTAVRVFSLRKNGTEFATITFAANATTGTFAGAACDFIAGDLFQVVAPAAQDATLANADLALAAVMN